MGKAAVARIALINDDTTYLELMHELLTLDPETRSIPVIVCSAAIQNLRAHEPLLQKFGVDVLPKPFDLEVLLAKVQSALEKGRMGPEDGRHLKAAEAWGGR